MTAFCLIHSSVQDASCWHDVAGQLEEHGHSTIAPDLGNIDPGSPADTYGRAIADSVFESFPLEDEEVWLLAHSASGLFLPWAAQYIDRGSLAGLIYLAAYAPSPGTSLVSTLAQHQEMFNDGWVGADPMDDSVAERFLFHDCPPEKLERALASRRLMIATKAMSEVFPAKAMFGGRSEYIVCQQDRTLTPAWMRDAALKRLGASPYEIDSGHCPQNARPSELVRTILRATASQQTD
jgi:hypothetical protein